MGSHKKMNKNSKSQKNPILGILGGNFWDNHSLVNILGKLIVQHLD